MNSYSQVTSALTVFGLLLAAAMASTVRAADQPQWGEALSRNMVSPEKGLPDTFDPATGQNVKWSVQLGTETYSTPVIAGGRVLIGTNNDRPRDPRRKGDAGVLLCLDEKDGSLRWQLVVPKRGPSPYLDWPRTGLVSPCTVEGDRVYLVSNRNEVMCLDLKGMADGNDGPYRDEARHMTPGKTPGSLLSDGPPAEDEEKPPEPGPGDADIIWLFNMDRGLGVHAHDAAHCSLLLHGQFLYACTSNGVDDTHKGFPSPDAPALAVFDKATGRLVARDDERMGRRTIHCTWSSPALGAVNGRPLVFFGGGDGVCYAFETPGPSESASNLKNVWRFDCDPAGPKENVLAWQDNRREGPSNIKGMPVFHENRVYVAAGGDLWHGKPEAWLKCIDATGTGDITRTGEVWSYPLRRHCMCTPAVWEGLVFIGDCGRQIHCLDARTGKVHWTHEAGGEVWASPLVADGKVYVATRSGMLWVLAADREKRVLGSVKLRGPINGSPVAANGTLYITTMTHLYAVARGASN